MVDSARSRPGASEHSIELRGRRYRYLTWGRADGEIVVLLHGRTSLAETWEEVAPSLADNRFVIALEQRGHGGSAWAPDGAYDLADFFDDYSEFVDKVVRGPHILVGHSMGSCTALVYASRHPDMVSALVLEDGGPPGPTVVQAVKDNLDRVPEDFASWDQAVEYISGEHPQLNPERNARRAELSVALSKDGRYRWHADMRGLLGDSHTDRDDTFLRGQWEAVDALRTPTVFFWASVPPCLVEPEVIDRMVEMNPMIRKVTFDTGHSIHEETPERFLREVQSFLAEERP